MRALRTMIITDPVYGNTEINEPVIELLIRSQTLARTKQIQQFGMPPAFYSFPGFTRYDHNIGVMLLLRKLGASLDEQIAGLLHDATHFAFSHVVDWVLCSTAKEDGHEKNHERILRDSDATKILADNGLNIETFIPLEEYQLLDRESPDLCADRVDYALREFHSWSNPSAIPEVLRNLAVHDNKIILRSKESAKLFSLNFLKLQTEHWGAPEPMVRYHYFSQMLKSALERGILSTDDFFVHDDYVMDKLRASNDTDVQSALDYLSKPVKFEIDNINPDIRMKKKFRFVDPEFLEDGELRRLSEHDDDYKQFLEEKRNTNAQGVNVKLTDTFG